ncbi:ABC transporter permease [Microbacterium sp. CFBP 8794]|uniref:ABC transporter permease n=1 Tax=Microbacterium sp. CFBP 8794 TaxID=2775269 RepID=UPI00178338DB|nr:ABC transporter permease [Microbacterium sp. CFBP 8794]MBD8478378.1 ABC transporter permease [Microbacterium sp. CFBP 8794]
MRAAVRAEMLRAHSGFSTMAVVVLALFIPVIVLTSDDTLGKMNVLDARRATLLVVAPLAWSFVAAAFAGSFSVTREYYYGSMSRSATQVGFARLFAGKALAAMVTGLVLTAGLAMVWAGVVVAVLGVNGLTPVFSSGVIRTLVGALLGAVAGALLGTAVGWIAGNYYAAAAVVLAGPTALELALLGTAPDMARFLPGLSLAALADPQNHLNLLPAVAAVLVATAWTVLLSALAWIVGRRRLT